MEYKVNKPIVIILGLERSGTTLMRGLLKLKLKTSFYDFNIHEGYHKNNFSYDVYDGKFYIDNVIDGEYDDMSPNMKYVYMLRDPRANISSLKYHLGGEVLWNKQENQEENIDRMSNIWQHHIDCYYKLINQGVPIIKVRYEDLVTDPSKVMNEIFEFLSIDPPNMNNETISTRIKRSSSYSDRISKGNHIYNDSIDIYKDKLTESEIRYIEKVNKLYMDKEGYDRIYR
jgi:hypothetical protein